MKIVNSILKVLLLAFTISATQALAQSGTDGGSSPTVTGTGTVNSVAKFSGTTTVTGSNLTEVNGQVGIGTTTPMANLTVANPSGDGVSSPQQGLVFVDTLFGVTNEWTHAAIYTVGSTQFNGSLVFATDGDGDPDFGVTEKMRIDPFGNVGIGTATPNTTLEVKGSITLTAGSGGAIIFPDGTRQFTAASGGSGSAASVPTGISEVGGFVGIGTPAPVSSLTIANSSGDYVSSPTQGLVFADSSSGPGNTPWTHAAIYSVGSTQFNGSLVFATDGDNANDFGVTEKMRIDPFGHVGIGTPSPGATLEINGNVKLTNGSGASITFADGTVQTTAYVGSGCTVADLVMPNKSVVAQGGDYAESVDVDGDKSSYEPGDVMVIDPTNPEHFIKSFQPYSTLVAGIYSTKPGYVGRRQPGDPKAANTEIPMAMIGIVPTKVTTENGSIHVGDLLVTSSKTGYAMRGSDRNAIGGAIVGKALAKLDSGTAIIEVLVTLQ